jgi:hypothetical protein
MLEAACLLQADRAREYSLAHRIFDHAEAKLPEYGASRLSRTLWSVVRSPGDRTARPYRGGQFRGGGDFAGQGPCQMPIHTSASVLTVSAVVLRTGSGMPAMAAKEW